ncbi:MAG TPA: NADH-quinone oxidoreductase subunit C [Bryobacteraceae bacterium]|nr:NADH-quinone oxidoreductase subunit C [Bryobacteraceae bacterium]
MITGNLSEQPLAAEIEAFDAAAILGGKFDRSELTLEIAPAKIASVCGFLKHELKFVRLSGITAVDRYPADPRFEIVYHLHSVERNQRLRLKCRVGGEQPEIDSVTSVWRGANWYEREVFDLFGVRFAGHPDLRRILLPDDWEGAPLRKDYPITGFRV